MITRNRDKRSAAEPVTQAEPQNEMDGLAAAAETHRRAAEQARSTASQHRAAAEARLAEARAAAAQLVAEGENQARALTAEATAADRQAAAIEERAGYLAHAAAQELQAAELDAQAEALAEERDQVISRIAGLDGQLEALRGERESVGGQLAAARATADLDSIASRRGRLDAVGEAESALTAQREPLQARLEAIGDGTGRGELFDVHTAASARRAELRRTLNIVDPARSEAQADELMAIIQAHQARIAQDAARTPDRRVVMR